MPFGDGIIATNDTLIGFETCEELFVPNSPHIDLTLQGYSLLYYHSLFLFALLINHLSANVFMKIDDYFVRSTCRHLP